jgi:hypothetical protein
MKKLLAIGLLFLGLNSFADEFTFKDLSGGMVSFPTSNTIPDNSASHIQNFYTDTYNMAEERNGYEKMSTTAIGNPSSVSGLWRFNDISGNEWIISFSSRSFYKNTSGNAPTVFGQLQTVDTIPDCDVNLGKFWCTDGTDNVWWFDGTSTGAVASAPKGRILEAWRTRIVISDVTSARSSVYFSEEGDGTIWTVGDLEVDPFIKQIGGTNDGYPVVGLENYLDNLVVFRRYDIWFMQGFDQTDLNVRNVSKEIGCIDLKTIQELDGSLLFLSNRGMEKMTGWTIENISEPIRNLTDDLVKNTANERASVQTTESDFNAGSFNLTLSSAIPGSVVLATQAATSFTDTSYANFALGTESDVSAVNITESFVRLGYDASELKDSNTGTRTGGVSTCGVERGVYLLNIPNTFALSNYHANLRRTESSYTPGDLVFRVRQGSSVGTIVSSTTYSASGVDTSYSYVNVSMPSPIVEISTSVGNGLWWIGIEGQSPCDLGNAVSWGNNSTDRQYMAYGHDIFSTGTFVSQAFDVGTTTNTWLWEWGTMTASTETNTGTIIYETQTSSSTTGTWESLQISTNGSAIQSTVQRYIRYKFSLATGASGRSPKVNDITLNVGDKRSRLGTFQTQAIDVGNQITRWDLFSGLDNKDGGNIEYQFNASSWTTFNESSWTTVLSGQIPTNATNTYCSVRSTFTITESTQNPSISELTVRWGEGSSSPRASGIYDRRYWLSMTTNTASTPYNDTILLYQRNKSWSLLKGINASSFAIWRDKLYFGDSTGIGYVYHFDVGNNDDGNDIVSSILTKSFDMGIPHKEKEFNRLYFNFTGNSAYTGSASMYYDIDRSQSEYSLGSVNLNEGTGNLLTKFHFPASNVIQGRELQYILKKSGTGDRLKLDGFITDVYPKEPK